MKYKVGDKVRVSGAMNGPSFADSQEGDSVRVRLTNKYVNGELADRFISEIR